MASMFHHGTANRWTAARIAQRQAMQDVTRQPDNGVRRFTELTQVLRRLCKGDDDYLNTRRRLVGDGAPVETMIYRIEREIEKRENAQAGGKTA